MTIIYLKAAGVSCDVTPDYGPIARPMEVTVFTSVKDDTVLEFARADIASSVNWPRTTVGAIRAWLAEQAKAAAAIADALAAAVDPVLEAARRAEDDVRPGEPAPAEIDHVDVETADAVDLEGDAQAVLAPVTPAADPTDDLPF